MLQSHTYYSPARQLPQRRLSRLGFFCIILGLAGGLFFGWQQRQGILLAAPTRPPVVIEPMLPNPAANSPKPAVAALAQSLPTSLGIPTLSIKTPLSSVGLDKTGAIMVPTDYHKAGWYNGGPAPGQIGPAIIVGHVDNQRGLGVFWRLGKIKPGALVYINRADGKTATFKVDQIKQYPQVSFPVEEVYGATNHAALRLITCSGTYNRQTHRYSHNTVVFASLVP